MTGKTTHILLVEDEEAHAELIRRAFQNQTSRMRLTIAGNLQEARAHLADTTPDLVIADLRLPDGEGSQLLPVDKESSPYPVVIMTSHGDEQVAVEAIKAGALDYVVKTDLALAAMPRVAQRALREWGYIIQRRKTERALRREKERFQVLVEESPLGISIIKTDGRYEYVNPKFIEMFGYTLEDIPTGKAWFKKAFPDRAYRKVAISTWIDDLQGSQCGESRPRTFNVMCKDGLEKIIYFRPVTLKSGDQFVICEDITDRKQAEEKQTQLEDQLRQAHKMEAVGQLAAGIAHDFNNLLTAINGFAALLQFEMSPDDPHQEFVEKILGSGQRAANLVSQLLAFSRKQIIKPQILSVNTAVADMDKMLRRIIGEHIQMKTILTPDLWYVKVDPSQIEQVIVNLAINARDAMPEGGRLLIETANVTLDDDYVSSHLGAQPGKHVLLAISDTGHGMSDEMKAHIFEPFFTTKEVGKGTGLGLATIFGIVKQSRGNIWVYSEEGVGTTFKVYLPRAAETGFPLPHTEVDEEMPSGSETILLVEDDAEVRRLTQRVLQGQGYTLLSAQNGQEAIQLAAQHPAPIGLLLTDVVMPGMSGKALAEKLSLIQPNLKMLFISGYTDNAIAHHRVLDPEVAFLQKPFSPKALSGKVRQVLDS